MQVRVGLKARNDTFQVGDDVVLLESTTTGTAELSQLVMHFLAEREIKPSRSLVFWMQATGERILGMLHDQVGSQGGENIINIEFDEEVEAPKMKDEIKEPDWIRAIALRNNFLLTGSFDRSLRLYSLPFVDPSQSIIATFKNPSLTEVPTCIVWLDQERFVVGYSNGTKLAIWNINNPSTPEQLLLKDNLSAIQDILSIEDIILVADYDGFVWKYSSDPKAASINTTLPVPLSSKKSKSSRSKSSTLLSSSLSIPLPEQQASFSIAVNDGAIAKLLKCKKDEIYCFGWNGNVTILQFPSLTIVKRLRLAADISAALIIKDRIVTAHGDGFIRLYDCGGNLVGGGRGRKTAVHNGWISSLSTGPSESSYFASAGHDGNVCIWSITDLSTPICPLMADSDGKGKILCLDWNNKMIVCGGEEKIARIFHDSVSHSTNCTYQK